MSERGDVDGAGEACRLITLAGYRALLPREQGAAVYTQAQLFGSELKGMGNPYPEGSRARFEWALGGQLALQRGL